MIRASVTGLAILWFSAPALASDFTANDQGQIEFSLPSGNIGCVYTPEGGTDTYEPAGGGPELSCDRVAPSYVRVILGPEGKARRYNDVGDASCCSGGTFSSCAICCYRFCITSSSIKRSPSIPRPPKISPIEPISFASSPPRDWRSTTRTPNTD